MSETQAELNYWGHKQQLASLEYEAKLLNAESTKYIEWFSILKPKYYIDGDKWCVLLGENIQTGICGFGNTLLAAIHNFGEEIEYKKCKKPTKED